MGVSAIYEIVTPYNAPDTRELGYEQTADLMKIWHLGYAPHELRRYGHNQWTLTPEVRGTTMTAPVIAGVAPVAPGSAGSPVSIDYVVTATDVDGHESLPSAPDSASNDLTVAGHYNIISWGAVAGAERYTVYKGVGGAFGYIGGTTGTSFNDTNINAELSDGPPGDRDPFPGVNDWPAVGTFHEQRTITGRTGHKPNGLFASQSGDINNYNVAFPAKASDAITLALTARGMNTIHGLLPMKDLLAFTDRGVWSVKGVDGYLSGSDLPLLTLESPRAASRVRPAAIDDVGVYGTLKGNRLRAVGFAFQIDGYQGSDLTVFAPHLFKSYTTKQIVWCEEELSSLFVVRSDGKMPALAFDREQQLLAWSLLYLGNSGLMFDPDDEGPSAAVPIADDTFESACTVQEDGEDRLYVIAQRARLGVDDDPQFRKYVERLALAPWTNPEWDDPAEAICLDSALSYTGAPTTTLSNLDHLEGRTVRVISNGAVIGGLVGYVVNGGQITLSTPTSAADGAITYVGLPYECWMRSLPPPGQDGAGSLKGRPIMHDQLTLDVMNTRGIEIATGKDRPAVMGDPTLAQDEAQEFFEVKTRESEPLGATTDPYTGQITVDMEAGDWSQATWVMRQRYPIPAVILGVAPEVNVGR